MIPSPQPHTRESLGVPSWFFCDGCSHAPDSRWLSPACDAHDWEYWRGSWGPVDKATADRDFRARIKHNAKFYPGSWFDRLWRPLMGEAYYFAVTHFGGPSWRTRGFEDIADFWDPETNEIDWETLAIRENKHAGYLR